MKASTLTSPKPAMCLVIFTKKLGLKLLTKAPGPSRAAFLDSLKSAKLLYTKHNDVKCWYLRQNLREKNSSMSGLMKPFVLLVLSAILASDTGWITRRLVVMN